MKQTKFTKIIALFAIFLILLNSVSALKIETSQPNDAKQGNNVYFDVGIALSREEMIQLTNEDIFIRHTKLTITGPNGFDKTCLIKEGHLIDCDLDLEVKEIRSPTTGSQESNDIIYQFSWNTPNGIATGTYNVNLELYLAEAIDAQYSYCDMLVGRYQALVNFDSTTLFDSDLDLNEDGLINLEDLVVFQDNPLYRQDGELFGRFEGYFMLIKEYNSYNPLLDLNGDGIINLSDIVLLAQELENKKLDLNGDGVEDLSDIILLSQHFKEGNLELDWNEDGIVDLSDVVLVVQYVESGNLEFDLNQDGVFDLSDVIIISQSLNPNFTTEYEKSLDLTGDEILNLSDLAVLAQNIQGSFEPEDLNGDGVIDLTETIIAAGNAKNEEWCAMQLEKIDGRVELFNADEKSFEITKRSTGGNSGGNSRNYEDEFVDYDSGEEYEGTYTPENESGYKMNSIWMLIFYVLAIIVAIFIIVKVVKKL